MRKDKRYEVKATDITGRRRSFYGRTLDEAQKKAESSRRDRDTSVFFGYYVAVYLPTKLDKAITTRRNIAWAFDKHILPAFGNRDLRSITRAEVQAFINNIRRKPRTVRSVFAWLRDLMTLALLDEAIDKDPCIRIRMPQIGPERTGHLSADELRTLRDGAEGDLRRFIILAGYLGLRKGEALGVTRAAIKNGVLKIERQIGEFGPMERVKTQGSRRAIPLPREIEQELSEGFVPCAIPYKDINGLVSEACERLGLPRVTVHGLRHSFGTILEVDLGAPRAVVAALMGHSIRESHAAYTHAHEAACRDWLYRLWTYTTLTTEICRQVTTNADSP